MPCGGDTADARDTSPGDAALDWSGETRSALPARMDKPLRCRPLEGQRDQEARSVVASSRVPRGERGVPVSLPAAGPVVRKETFLRRLAGLLSRYLPTDT